MCVFRNFEEMAVYPTDKLIHNQNVFLGLIEIGKEKSEERDNQKLEEEEDEEDLDGVPLEEEKSVQNMNESLYDDDGIDGIPLHEEVKPSTSTYSTASKFKPVEVSSRITP